MRDQKEESTMMDTQNFFELIYHGKPPWDIDRPQKEYVQLEQAGEIVGSVLDVGCGTGENALYLAAQGHEVWGIDFTPTAIQKAQEKAAQRHLTATFRVLNVLELHTLGRTFDTVIDSGLFHTLSDEERPLFVDNLAAVVRRGGTYFMLCFSELTQMPDPSKLKDFLPDFDKLKDVFPDGPSRVTQAEIRALFREGWSINYIRQATFGSGMDPDAIQGWLSSISKE
jgi:cyclopropane fatty-acyl-phospholipid synthase-like methyltransferase